MDQLKLLKTFTRMDRPRYMPYELPVCVIFEFQQSTIAKDSKWRRDLDKTFISIFPVTVHCKKKCCTVTSIPLRVWKVITFLKSQGMSIGPGNLFESVIIYPSEKEERTNPGSELVIFSRVTDVSALVICDTN